MTISECLCHGFGVLSSQTINDVISIVQNPNTKSEDLSALKAILETMFSKNSKEVSDINPHDSLKNLIQELKKV
jgi:hypothetical protein